MQYHVPAGFVNASAPVASSNPSGTQNRCFASISSSVPKPASTHAVCHDGSPTGIAVAQGLLRGRRLTVRVAPPPVEAPSPVHSSPSTPHANSSTVLSCATNATPSNPHPQSKFTTHVQQLNWLSLPPRQPAQGSTQNQQAASSTAYGGGIVRISDLRRQGVQLVETGLGLPTVQASRLTSVRVTPSNDENMPFADVFAAASAVAAPTRRGRRTTGSVPPSATRSRQRRRARGSTKARRSPRGSLDVTLNENGELCDYRWFTARGRRCFVYDGRTYKGSTAHRMWAKVKEAASQRVRAGQQLWQRQGDGCMTEQTFTTATATRTDRAVAAAPGHRVSRVTRSTSRTVPSSTRTSPHRTSARALSAASRSLDLENVASFSVNSCRLGLTSPTGPPPLRDEWRDLMRELSVEVEDDGMSLTAPTPLAHHSCSSHTKAPKPCEASHAARDIVEITDSSSDDESFSSSDTEDSSFSEKIEETSGTSPLPPQNTSQNTSPPPLQWPTTSYFSDESSGWSSTSSPAQRGDSPASKKEKTESCALHTQQTQKQRSGPACPPAPGPRVHFLHGVEVVEEDGWVYPAEVYASQKQQRRQQRQQQLLPPSAHSNKKIKTPRSPIPHSSAETYLDAFGLDALHHASDDTPLSALFTQPAVSNVVHATASMSEHENMLLRGALSSLSAPSLCHAGIAVIVGGKDQAVPLRPTTAVSAAAAATRDSAAVLRGVSDDSDLLDGFTGTDLAGMFVTGEEIGGVRYGS